MRRPERTPVRRLIEPTTPMERFMDTLLNIAVFVWLMQGESKRQRRFQKRTKEN